MMKGPFLGPFSIHDKIHDKRTDKKNSSNKKPLETIGIKRFIFGRSERI